jgi:hypothetical protein
MTAKAAKKKTDSARAAVIDQLGQYEQDIAALEEIKKLAAPLRAEVRSWFADLPAETAATAEGFKFLLTVGPRENERSIKSMMQVLDRVGSEVFLAECSLTLKALRDIVTPPDFEALTTQARTGARAVNTFARSKG